MRFCVQDDLVTRIPSLLGYRHVGHEVWRLHPAAACCETHQHNKHGIDLLCMTDTAVCSALAVLHAH